MKITLNNTTLAAGKAFDEEPLSCSIVARRLVQEVCLIGAKAVQKKDRGNVQHLLSFTVIKKHASADRALAYSLALSGSLENASGVLTCQCEDSGQVAVLETAVISKIQTSVRGPLTHVYYEIVGGLLTHIKPS